MSDWLSALLQWVFASLVWELLLGLGVGSLISLLIAKKNRWALPLLGGLAGFALILAIGFAVTGHSLLAKAPVEITPENLSTNVHAWLDGFSVHVSDDPGMYFKYDVMLNGIGMVVARPMIRGKYLIVGGDLVMNSAQKAQMKKLTPVQMALITHTLSRELAQSNLAVANFFPDKVVIQTGIPITSAMSEDELMKTFQSVGSAIIAARESVELELTQLGVPFPG